MLNSADEQEVECGEGQVEAILEVLKELTGITIPVQKKMMVVFRLRKRLAQLEHPPLREYAARVRKDRGEQQTFINLLTTNETHFFRTPRIWSYFSNEYLPQHLALRGSEVLRAWSAASSTGEEACSIAMACHEFQMRQPSFRFQILATDVDTEVLAKAETGVFGVKTVERLQKSNPDLAGRYFQQRVAGHYEVDARLKHNMRFMTHNLMTRPRLLGLHHIVFLRNVLIYFREPEQTTILHQMAAAMAPGAVLILGESESLSALETQFGFVQPQIYRKLV